MIRMGWKTRTTLGVVGIGFAVAGCAPNVATVEGNLVPLTCGLNPKDSKTQTLTRNEANELRVGCKGGWGYILFNEISGRFQIKPLVWGDTKGIISLDADSPFTCETVDSLFLRLTPNYYRDAEEDILKVDLSCQAPGGKETK